MGMPLQEQQVMKETSVKVDVKEGKLDIESDNDILLPFVLGVIVAIGTYHLAIKKWMK